MKIAFQLEQGVPAIDKFYTGQALAALLPRVAELGYPHVAFDILSQLSALPTVHTVPLGGKGKLYRDPEAEVRTQGMVMKWVPEMLRGMAPHLDAEWLRKAYEFSKSVQHKPTQAGMLAPIGPRLGITFLPEVLSEVEQIWDGNGERWEALVVALE